MLTQPPKLGFARKLLILAILPTTLAVLLCCGALAVDRVFAVERIALHNLTATAEMVAIHVAAPMSFSDTAAAAETLLVLREADDVASARLYDDKGAVFATYARGKKPGPLHDAPRAIGYETEEGWFTLTVPVTHKEKMLGRLTVTDDMGEWYSQLRRDIAIVVGVGIIAFGIATLLAVRLRRALVRPITALAATARDVSRNRNYTVRAARFSHDELGDLTDGFNEMLAQVQSRDAALERRADELASLNTELEQFAYVASHDLQEPLRMVGSYLQLIEKRYGEKFDADAREFIGFAVDGAGRMKRLITDLLAFSRIGTRGQVFKPTPLGMALDDALANLKTTIADSGAEITRDLLPTVHGDQSQLMQLFQNLLGNALKFRGKETPRVHVGAVRKDDHWQISVADNGIGIAPQYAERIFVIFQRLTPGQHPGTGIGLAVCKKIVERHGGRIWVESVEGRGATFFFTLPDERN